MGTTSVRSTSTLVEEKWSRMYVTYVFGFMNHFYSERFLDIGHIIVMGEPKKKYEPNEQAYTTD